MRKVSVIREARLKQGLTRAELAERAGVSESALYQIEVNGHIPTRGVVDRLARVLGDCVYTVFQDDEPRATSP